MLKRHLLLIFQQNLFFIVVITLSFRFQNLGYNYDKEVSGSIRLVKNMLNKEMESMAENSKEIVIKYFSDKIEKLCYIDGKSDWIDLRSADDVELKAGEFKLIPLGVGMKLPVGYEAHVVPRSSTFKNFGIIQTNHMGVIDYTYSGDNDQWFMPVYALRDTKISVNDRICQFRIMENQPSINFVEVEHLEGPDRGGFGSTGKQ